MKPAAPVTALLMSTATLALAHTGLEDADAMAPLEGMKATGDTTRTLGQMAKGDAPFGAATARARFEIAATDPQSQAGPAILDNWTDLTA